MTPFGKHYPIGITRTCKGSMTLRDQRQALKDAGVKNIWRLGVDGLDDVMVGFHRRTEDDKPEPTVLVTPIPAVVGNDRRDIFETLARLGQSLYDLELERFINLEGAEDIILYERRCHKQRANYARKFSKGGGRPSLLSLNTWKALANIWCARDMAHINNDDIVDGWGVSPAAAINRFGGRKLCVAAGEPVKEGWNK